MLLALWLVAGVSARDALGFLAFEAAFALVPGWLVYGALDPEASAARRLAFGWALGYVLLVAAFGITAAAGQRGLLWLYPPLVAGAALAAKGARRRGGPEANERTRVIATAATIAATVALVALAAFPPNPLPGTVQSVTYDHDVVFAVALAGDVLHHWPPGDPHVAGLPFHYHWFAHVRMAAAAQITKDGLPVIVMRLAPLPLVALFVLVAIEAGTALAGSLAAGIGAAVLPLFGTELDLDPKTLWPFNGLFFTSVCSSPSLLLSLVLFVPALALAAGRLERPVREARGQWVLLGLFLAGCAGAKSATLPVLGGGVVLYLGWGLARRRRLERGAAAVLALVAGTYAVFWLALYRNGIGDLPPTFAAFGSVRTMSAVTFWQHARPGPMRALLLAAAAAIGSAGLLAPVLAGVAWLLPRGLRPWEVLFVGVFGASLVPFYVLNEPGASEVFFAELGLVAACVVAAAGIARALATRRDRRGLAAYAAGWTVVLLAVTLVPTGLAARTETLLRYGIFAAVVAAVGLLAARTRRATWARALLVTILAAAALNVPLDLVPALVSRHRDGRPQYETAGNGLTPGLLRGLDWLRSNTPTGTVLAANNYVVDRSSGTADDFYYSAFSERRVFLEGWVTSLDAWRLGAKAIAAGAVPYPKRLALNEAVFQRADADALATLVGRYGVRYLVVDRLHRGASPRLARLGTRVFANHDVTIYAVGRAA